MEIELHFSKLLLCPLGIQLVCKSKHVIETFVVKAVLTMLVDTVIFGIRQPFFHILSKLLHILRCTLAACHLLKSALYLLELAGVYMEGGIVLVKEAAECL